jgi:hypothetical protein
MQACRNSQQLLGDLMSECPDPDWAELHHGPNYSVQLHHGPNHMSHPKLICNLEYMLLSWYFKAHDIPVHCR